MLGGGAWAGDKAAGDRSSAGTEIVAMPEVTLNS